VVVVVRSRGAERAKAFATALSQRWQMDPNIDWLAGHRAYRSPWATVFTKDAKVFSNDGVSVVG
jgi:hypothetical protein